jgi:hypothetical protein
MNLNSFNLKFLRYLLYQSRNIFLIIYYHYYDTNTIKVNQCWNFNWIITFELQDHKTDFTERYSYLRSKRSPFVAYNQPFCLVAEDLEFVIGICMGHRNIWKGLPWVAPADRVRLLRGKEVVGKDCAQCCSWDCVGATSALHFCIKSWEVGGRWNCGDMQYVSTPIVMGAFLLLVYFNDSSVFPSACFKT